MMLLQEEAKKKPEEDPINQSLCRNTLSVAIISIMTIIFTLWGRLSSLKIFFLQKTL